MREAMFYEKLKKFKVRCYLCAHHCIVANNKRGLCGVRENRDGTLYSLVYAKVISTNIDPIEKKPMFHFFPSSRSFSIATVGCNFKCRHCQNYDIAHYPRAHEDIPGENITPEAVVDAAERAGCRSISYTYTEPTIFFEFAYECAQRAHDRGIKNVFVSNGYTSPEATRKMAPFLDGNNIDLKGDDEFYKKICGARLAPVQETIKLMKELGVWVELTTLIIPSYNDSEKIVNEIIDFIKSVDPEMPWHVSGFYPTYQLQDQPRTPLHTLRRIRDKGLESGLKHIYEGNVPGEGRENTYCSRCGEMLIRRSGYTILANNIKGDSCYNCNNVVKGVWR